MTYPRVQFVAAPEPDALVRFDFNNAGSWADDETWADHDGFSLGTPSVEGDPTGVGVEYGYRTLEFNLIIRGSRQAALRQQSSLAREVMRASNWLMFQLSAFNKPVWFKTYRSEPGALDFEHVYLDDDVNTWGVGVSMVADPFAYGERVTLPAVTIYNDPAAATNPMSYVLPEIVGDAPAPLTVTLAPASSNTNARIHMARAAAEPTFWQVGTGDGWTADADTGAPVADAAYSGGSYRAVTFATFPDLGSRLYGIYPVVPAPGRYAILVRVARSDTSSTFTLQGSQQFGLSTISGEEVPFAPDSGGSAGWASWVNLGEFSIPVGLGDMSSEMSYAGGGSFYFNASRTTGTGSLHIDAFMLVPVVLAGDATDAATLTADFANTGLGVVGGANHVWDGTAEATYLSTAGGYYDTLPPFLRGDFLKAVPGETNVVHLIRQAGGLSPLGGSDAIGETTEMSVSYQPRWLYLGAD